MALRDTALTTLASLKSALTIATADTSKDTLLEQCIDRATQWIEGRTERKLKARNYNGFNASGEGSDFEHKTSSTGDTVASEDFLFFTSTDTIRDEEGRGVYHMPQFPVLKVNGSNQNIINHPSALTFRLQYLASRGSTVSGNETWTSMVEYDDYLVEHQNGIIRLLGGIFGAGIRNYRVKCSAGFSLKPANTQPYAPPDLEALCIEFAKQLYRDNRGLIGESIGTWSRQFSVTLKENDPFVQETLARYRRFAL